MNKASLFFVFVCLVISFTACSPKMKVELWAKGHRNAATDLEAWGTNHPLDAAELFGLNCINRKQFKQRITDALQQPKQQNNYHYTNAGSFEEWCRHYPHAARRLRSHARAICKAGLDELNTCIKTK